MVDICKAMGIALDEAEPYVLFHSGIFSQWYKSPFHAALVVGENQSTIHHWNSCEQYMMASKAALFNDIPALKKILKTVNPKAVKLIGRGVLGFDETTWNQNKFNIVTEGNYQKFKQNKLLLAKVR